MKGADMRLVKRAQQGDMDAFEELYMANMGRMYNAALRLMGREADAQDAVQEGMLKAWRAIGGFKGNSEFSTWLYRITVNVCKDMLKKRGGDVLSSDVLQEEGWEVGTEGFESSSIERNALLHALQCITPEHREIIVLKDIEDLTYDQIALVLDIPMGTVRSRLNRARERLKISYLNQGTKSDVFASKPIKDGAENGDM